MVFRQDMGSKTLQILLYQLSMIKALSWASAKISTGSGLAFLNTI